MIDISEGRKDEIKLKTLFIMQNVLVFTQVSYVLTSWTEVFFPDEKDKSTIKTARSLWINILKIFKDSSLQWKTCWR